MQSMKSISLQQVQVDDRFWNHYTSLVRDVIIPYQRQVLNDELPGVERSNAFENFRIAAGEAEGDFYGEVFQDSDVAKWLEAVAYSLTTKSDPELETIADEVIDLIARAQEPDGYLNTFFIGDRKDQRWTNLTEDHELYCAGHLIEAAVAYYQATGKDTLLRVARAFADHIDSVFGSEPEKLKGYPGHEEIELALVKLYGVTGENRYLKLAKYFVDERGREPNYLDAEYENCADKSKYRNPREWGLKYSQAHLPVREQATAEGHSVRAMYLYAAMADLARETGDKELAEACKRLWRNVTQRRMYITGGIGSQAYGEGFTMDYDLPNDRSYTETCASIGLIFWAQRMLNLEADRQYADICERALYNGVLAGMSLDGKKFFYVNPLEVWPESCANRHDQRHVKTTRQAWFSCACCPPNLARLLASLGQYCYSYGENEVYVHLYVGGRAVANVAGNKVQLDQRTDFPWDGRVELTVSPETAGEFTLCLRIPGWCDKPSIRLNGVNVELGPITEKGYAKLTRLWSEGDRVELDFPMEIKRIYAHPNVRMNAGKIAIARGPMIYCLEESDNGSVLTDIALPREAALEASYDPDLLGGVMVISGEALRSGESPSDDLYDTKPPEKVVASLKGIPYYAWNNRGEGEMLVWIREC